MGGAEVPPSILAVTTANEARRRHRGLWMPRQVAFTFQVHSDPWPWVAMGVTLMQRLSPSRGAEEGIHLLSLGLIQWGVFAEQCHLI